MYANEDKEFPRKKLVETFCKNPLQTLHHFSNSYEWDGCIIQPTLRFLQNENIVDTPEKVNLCDDEDDTSELQSAVTGV